MAYDYNNAQAQEQSKFQKDWAAWKAAQQRGYQGGFASYLMDGGAMPPAQPIARGDVPASAGRIISPQPKAQPPQQNSAPQPKAQAQDEDTYAMYNSGDNNDNGNDDYYVEPDEPTPPSAPAYNDPYAGDYASQYEDRDTPITTWRADDNSSNSKDPSEMTEEEAIQYAMNYRPTVRSVADWVRANTPEYHQPDYSGWGKTRW